MPTKISRRRRLFALPIELCLSFAGRLESPWRGPPVNGCLDLHTARSDQPCRFANFGLGGTPVASDVPAFTVEYGFNSLQCHSLVQAKVASLSHLQRSRDRVTQDVNLVPFACSPFAEQQLTKPLPSPAPSSSHVNRAPHED